MIQPLHTHLAPLTFSWCFFQCNLAQLQAGVGAWMAELGISYDIQEYSAPLEQALQLLQPLTLPPSKRLFVATTSSWTACFDNGANGGDYLSLMTVLTSRLQCSGLVVRCIDDKRMYSSKDQHPHFTSLGFQVFQTKGERLTGPTRFVSLSQYYGKWRFSEGGEPLAVEQLATCDSSRSRKNVTLDMINAVCQSLGVTPFASSFYLDQTVLVSASPVVSEVALTLSEARSVFGLSTQ